jgi:hypothetical protein
MALNLEQMEFVAVSAVDDFGRRVTTGILHEVRVRWFASSRKLICLQPLIRLDGIQSRRLKPVRCLYTKPATLVYTYFSLSPSLSLSVCLFL